MSLRRLTSKKTLNVLGLNSGTSADGLDMALMQISSGKAPRIRYLTGRSVRYPAELRKLALDIADSEQVSLDDLIYLDNLLGRFYGQAAARMIRRLSERRIRVDAVASHGQTIRHLPVKTRKAGATLRGTLQLGSAEFIAAATDRVVVSDFRQADIALGGEGAPITVGAMHRIYADGREPRLIVNIGGISNYFYFPATRSLGSIQAADCGPGNSLSDILSEKLFKEKFDRGGRRARRGTVSDKLLARLLNEPFFGGATISTGREAFGTKLAGRMITAAARMKLSGEDLMATAAALTAESIARSVRRLTRRDKSLSKLYLTGGGKHNMFFVKNLSRLLGQLTVRPIDDLGIDGDFVEAAAYAVIGEACLRSAALLVSTDARRRNRLKPVLGKITQPPQR